MNKFAREHWPTFVWPTLDNQPTALVKRTLALVKFDANYNATKSNALVDKTQIESELT